MSARTPVTIVCVWNDELVRANCLDASIAALLDTAPDTEYLPIDNRGQQHPSAGAALNLGARRASNEVVVFVHQDVHLHSLVALEHAAGALTTSADFALLGAVGITDAGELVGRMRDRVVLLGSPTDLPREVDSLDEVLFLAARSTLLEHPLAEDPDLAWHAYAVEYGLRLRARGHRVGALDIPLTHNSMSTNLARLDHAHAHLAREYPDQVPVRTTCGTVRSPTATSERRRLLPSHRWRVSWARESRVAWSTRRTVGTDQIVLADIRYDVDTVLGHLPGRALTVTSLTSAGEPFPDAGVTTLARGEATIRCRTAADDHLDDLDLDSDLLVTNVGQAHLEQLRSRLVGVPHVVGYHEGPGHWILLGDGARARERIWTSARSRPAGFRR